MRAEFFTARNYFHDPIAQLFRIKRAEAHAIQRASLGDHLEQLGKVDLRFEVLAVPTKMNPGQHDFLEAALMQIVERRHHAARLDAARGAARKRYDAECAKLIAALLQFQERARMTVERDRGQLDRRLLLAQIRDHHALARTRSHCALEVVKPPKSN